MVAPVAAVIPTRRRPAAVVAAVRSAWAQFLPPAEVIVVIDGPDDETAAALATLPRDGPLQVVELEVRGGGSRARNLGVQAASSPWIAFLDDDDLWLPRKLSVQVPLLRDASSVAAGRVTAVTATGDFTWPRRMPAPSEPLSEYLFVRRGLFHGEGFVQTSTIIANRRLLLEVPFDETRPRHQDWDWLLRAAAHQHIGLVFPEEPVAVLSTEQATPGVSRSEDWEDSLRWVSARRDLFTSRSAAAFVLVNVVASAVEAKALGAIPRLVVYAFRTGRPRLHDLALTVGLVLVPRAARRRLRALLETR